MNGYIFVRDGLMYWRSENSVYKVNTDGTVEFLWRHFVPGKIYIAGKTEAEIEKMIKRNKGRNKIGDFTIFLKNLYIIMKEDVELFEAAVSEYNQKSREGYLG